MAKQGFQTDIMQILNRKFKENIKDYLKFVVLRAVERWEKLFLVKLAQIRIEHFEEFEMSSGSKKRKKHVCNICKRHGDIDQLYLLFIEKKMAYNLSLANHVQDMLLGSCRPNYQLMNQREGKMTENQAVLKLRGISELSEKEFRFGVCLIMDYSFRDLFEVLRDTEIVDVIRMKMELDGKM